MKKTHNRLETEIGNDGLGEANARAVALNLYSIEVLEIALQILTRTAGPLI